MNKENNHIAAKADNTRHTKLTLDTDSPFGDHGSMEPWDHPRANEGHRITLILHVWYRTSKKIELYLLR